MGDPYRVYRARLFVCALGMSIALQGTQCAAGAVGSSQQDAKQRLKEIEKAHAENQKMLAEARRKEALALQQLHRVKSNLSETTHSMNFTQQKLQKTESLIQRTETRITQTKSQEEVMSDAAGARLRQIYEGQRVGLLEMMFQVSSLQSILDLFYYQERIADADRKLLKELRANAEALMAKKGQLGSQKKSLGGLLSEFAQRALQLNKEKDSQERVAEKLRSQRAFYEEAERRLAQESAQLERQIQQMVSGDAGKSLKQGSGILAWPLRAPITSPFGPRHHPIFRIRRFHTGIDLAGPNRSAIRAADSGSVLMTGPFGGYGKVVIISHGKGKSTLYAHLSKVAVSAGASVQKGEVIGYEGSTGFSTGPHLHFEVRVDGKPNNPLNYLK